MMSCQPLLRTRTYPLIFLKHCIAAVCSRTCSRFIDSCAHLLNYRGLCEHPDAAPGTPTNLRAVALSPTSIHVSWDSPSDPVTASSSAAPTGGDVTDADSMGGTPPTRTLYYRLYYYDMHDTTASGENDVTVTEREVELRDLCKFCEYSLRVVAYSAVGSSAGSEEVTCRTLSDGEWSIFFFLTARATSFVNAASGVQRLPRVVVLFGF
jgi:hypothetical protein